MALIRNNADVDIDWNRSTVKIKSGEIAEVDSDLVEAVMRIYPFLSIEESVVEMVEEAPVEKPAKKRKPRAEKAKSSK